MFFISYYALLDVSLRGISNTHARVITDDPRNTNTGIGKSASAIMGAKTAAMLVSMLAMVRTNGTRVGLKVLLIVKKLTVDSDFRHAMIPK